MTPHEEKKVNAVGYLADIALNPFKAEDFSIAFIAFKKRVGSELDIAFYSVGESHRIIEALRNTADKMEREQKD